MASIASLIEKAKKDKEKSKDDPMVDMDDEGMGGKEVADEEESESDEESGTEELDAMKLFEDASSTEEKLKAFKMLMKACGY